MKSLKLCTSISKSTTDYLSSFFTTTRQIHNRPTRSHSHNTLHLPKISTSRCQRSIKFQGTKIWYSIPIELQNQSFYKFKFNFKSFCITIILLTTY